MTVGKDVSLLFPDIAKNMENRDMELKKLVYLYVINYAKKHPQKVVMVINTFLKDAVAKDNPLLRALAVRTMGCITVSAMTEYLCDTLNKAISVRQAMLGRVVISPRTRTLMSGRLQPSVLLSSMTRRLSSLRIWAS